MPWDKSKYAIGYGIGIPVKEQSKRGMLKYLASTFDPLGLISPATLPGKHMYREACDLKLSWDEQLTEPLKTKWIKWSESLPRKFAVSRSIPAFKDEILSVDRFFEIQVLKVSQLYCMLLFIKRTEEVKEY